MVTDRWFAARRTLYELLHAHPDWSNRQFATALNASTDWVHKWKARIGSPPHPDPEISPDFYMASVIRTTASMLQQIGLPARIRMDCDVRLVGNNRLANFPSPFQRLLLNLGIQVEVCPPHQPNLKPFVERFHKNYKGESLYPNWPTTEAEAQTQVDAYCTWYRTDRPRQGRACGNRPPAEALPELPVLPAVPVQVDADGSAAYNSG